jgi:hypothetical protein
MSAQGDSIAFQPWFRILISFLLVAVLAIEAISLAVTLRRPRAGRFLPLTGNPYLLLDTATGTECLRVPRNRGGEMTNWLLYTDRDKDVHDSYTAALEAYGGLQKQYAEDYENSRRPPEDKTSKRSAGAGWVDDVLREIDKGFKITAESDKVASERARKEFDALTQLLRSVDSIPVCSTK